MEFTNKLLSFVFVITQLLAVLSAPLSERTFLPIRSDSNTPFITFLKPDNWGSKIYAYVYNDNYEINAWPGVEMRNVNSKTIYEISFDFDTYADDSYVIFSDGSKQIPASMKQGFDLTMNAVYNSNGIVGTANGYHINADGSYEISYNNNVTVYYRPNLAEKAENNEVYIHYKVGDGNWTTVPGQLMTITEHGYYYATINLDKADSITFCFNDGKDNWDNNDKKDYTYKKFKNIIIDQRFNEDITTFTK